MLWLVNNVNKMLNSMNNKKNNMNNNIFRKNIFLNIDRSCLCFTDNDFMFPSTTSEKKEYIMTIITKYAITNSRNAMSSRVSDCNLVMNNGSSGMKLFTKRFNA